MWAWNVESDEVTPDIRGITAGESFYSYYEFNVMKEEEDVDC